MPPKSDADSIVTEECDDYQIDIESESCTTFDSDIFVNEINVGEMDTNCMSISSKEVTLVPSPHVENQKPFLWEIEYPESEIIVIEIIKLAGLGISIEGTVEVDGGVEKKPHHFIRSILRDSPVAIDGKLKPGDELLQVNEYNLTNLNHTEVVKILKELPRNVRVVCARGHAPSIINTSQNLEAFESRSIVPSGHLLLQGLLKAQSESSLFSSNTNTNTNTYTNTDQQRSKSLEQVSGLAMWSSEPVFIDFEKTERGFGFSILDYQDPLSTENILIVVRGLIPGGPAESSNLIFPGDRIVSVGEHDLQGCSLGETVSIIKSMPMGLVRIGLCRPLSTSENNISSPESPT